MVEGNVGDPKTLLPQVEKARTAFGLDRLVLVGDRGMISNVQVDAMRRMEGVDWITLDLSELNFIDSLGVKAVLAAAALCANHEYEFLVTPGLPKVQRVFELTGLVEFLPFDEDPE